MRRKGKSMWDVAKQQQLDALRRQEQLTGLTDGERRTLEQLFHELEQEEWRMLRPALDRLRQEQAQLQHEGGGMRTQNAVLAAIAERQADLRARARIQLTALLQEQAMLKSEYERALDQPSSDL
ncbi:MAG TPA: hypothetical protein VNO70_18025 [Blastocatellia bacterium]|nr:hypothetical protein [Blastocatellia bacterium]